MTACILQAVLLIAVDVQYGLPYKNLRGSTSVPQALREFHCSAFCRLEKAVLSTCDPSIRGCLHEKTAHVCNLYVRLRYDVLHSGNHKHLPKLPSKPSDKQLCVTIHFKRSMAFFLSVVTHKSDHITAARNCVA